ncbi:MAG: hypothetical protein QQN50_07025 [Nitrosopumilus sp.]
MIEMLFRQIVENELLDKEFCKYLEKRLEDNVVDELQIEIQILIGNIVPGK